MASPLKLMPFQEDGVAFLTESPHRLLADDMGLGKTIQVIAAMDKINARSVVVICPATVKIHWARKIAEWSKMQHTAFIVTGGKAKIPAHATVIIVNYELLLQNSIYKQLIARGKTQGYDAVVMDEAHYLKSLSAKRTKRVLGSASFLHFAKYKWPLTGTPVLNRPADIYPLLYTLAQENLGEYTSWRAFGERYCGAHRNYMGILTHKGATHIAELAERLEGFMLRRKKEDVLDQLPDKMETVVELICPIPIEAADAPIATVRRQLAIAKIPEAVKHISGMLEDTEKIVVFAHHRTVIESLQEALLPYGPVILYGGLNIDQKQNAIDGFVNNPKVRILIAQTMAGGTGVDGLQGVCNHVVFIELDWSPGVMDQAIDRLRRIGQKNTVFVQYLAVANSIDTQINASLADKRNVIEQLIKAKEVEKMTQSTDIQVKMAIADALTAIANALNAIATLADVVMEPAQSGQVATIKETKPAAGKRGTAKQEPVEAPASAPPAPATVVYSEEDLRKAAGEFIGAPGDRDAHRAIINSTIWPKYGATALANMPKEHYAAAIADLQLGPEAYKAPASDLSGI